MKLMLVSHAAEDLPQIIRSMETLASVFEGRGRELLQQAEKMREDKAVLEKRLQTEKGDQQSDLK
ncbi:hypothetical protein DN068_12155 [Taibaiella soli]|uniref:Uncharacterized protein n=1 Tax=Taibaiella soli TaxID=1649169 RepID=A0A2W2AGG0_9BACT|nr:hypothetical protein DN068_12155 [Taibaiella soli]